MCVFFLGGCAPLSASGDHVILPNSSTDIINTEWVAEEKRKKEIRKKK